MYHQCVKRHINQCWRLFNHRFNHRFNHHCTIHKPCMDSTPLYIVTTNLGHCTHCLLGYWPAAGLDVEINIFSKSFSNLKKKCVDGCFCVFNFMAVYVFCGFMAVYLFFVFYGCLFVFVFYSCLFVFCVLWVI